MKHIYYCGEARLTQGQLDMLQGGGSKLTEIDLQTQEAAVGKLHELGYLWGGLSWNPPMPTPSKQPRMETCAEAAAVVTLLNLSYTYEGGVQWKPPLGRTLTAEQVRAIFHRNYRHYSGNEWSVSPGNAMVIAKELAGRGQPGKDLGQGVAPACPPAPAPAGVVSKKHSHYYRPCPFPLVDVYRVLRLFNVKNQEIGHAIKKLLCSGLRGAKDHDKDVQEAIDTLLRHLEMNKEEREFGCVNASEGP